MSREDVQLVRCLYEAYSSADLAAAIEAVCEPEIQWQASEGFGLLRGRDAVIRHFEGFLDAFDDWQVAADELLDAGDGRIVGVTHAHGKAKSSGVDVDARYAIVFLIRGNLIARAREYATRSDALAAVGLAN